jgi:hypothetical protein
LKGDAVEEPFEVGAEAIVELDELDGAGGVGVDLVDAEDVEGGSRRHGGGDEN